MIASTVNYVDKVTVSYTVWMEQCHDSVGFSSLHVILFPGSSQESVWESLESLIICTVMHNMWCDEIIANAVRT